MAQRELQFEVDRNASQHPGEKKTESCSRVELSKGDLESLTTCIDMPVRAKLVQASTCTEI
jgi:hypothetical protein